MYGRHKYATPTYKRPKVAKRRIDCAQRSFDPSKVTRSVGGSCAA
jgi:hypothetical protein